MDFCGWMDEINNFALSENFSSALQYIVTTVLKLKRVLSLLQERGYGVTLVLGYIRVIL